MVTEEEEDIRGGGAGGARAPLLPGAAAPLPGGPWVKVGVVSVGGGTGAVMLMESCEPRDETEWEELKEAEELCRLGRRRWTLGEEEGMLQLYTAS